MRILFFCVILIYSTTGFSRSFDSGDRNNWYIDLGGKTVEVLGSTGSLTGVRAGAILPSKLYIGAAAFRLTKEYESSENNTYRKQKTFSFIGVHVEYPFALNERFTFSPGLLAGTAAGRYEEREGDVYGTVDKAYFNIEPSFLLSVWIIKGMWLNTGVSYSLVDGDMGMEKGPMYNIYARYLW